MANTVKSAIVLNDAASTPATAYTVNVSGVILSRALVGTLTVSGLAAPNGQPAADWVLNAASGTGWKALPGTYSGHAPLVHATLSNVAADAGAATLVC